MQVHTDMNSSTNIKSSEIEKATFLHWLWIAEPIGIQHIWCWGTLMYSRITFECLLQLVLMIFWPWIWTIMNSSMFDTCSVYHMTFGYIQCLCQNILELQFIWHAIPPIFRTTSLTLYHICDALFNHLEDSMDWLESKQTAWKKSIYQSLLTAKKKLSEYDNKTCGFHGIIYAIATILDSCQKLSVLKKNTWQTNSGKHWDVRYLHVIKKIFTYYCNQFSDTKIATVQPLHLNVLDNAWTVQNISMIFQLTQLTMVMSSNMLNWKYI